MAVTQLLRPDEVAARLRVARATVYRLLDRGELRGVRIGEGPKAHLRVEASELDAYIHRTRVGNDIAERAERILELRGDERTPENYAEALREAGDYEGEMLVDRSVLAIRADVDAAEQAGYVPGADAPAVEAVMVDDRVLRILAADSSSGAVDVDGRQVDYAVDVEGIISDEFRRLGDPLPTEVARAGMAGVGNRARRILRDKGITEYDAASYRQAVRQALSDLQSPKRSV